MIFRMKIIGDWRTRWLNFYIPSNYILVYVVWISSTAQISLSGLSYPVPQKTNMLLAALSWPVNLRERGQLEPSTWEQLLVGR